MGESLSAELFSLDNIGYYPAQWARERNWRGTAAEVFHWISAGVVQMLPYNSGTFCGHQLHSVVINYPVYSLQTKVFSFSNSLEMFPGKKGKLGTEYKVQNLMSLSMH